MAAGPLGDHDRPLSEINVTPLVDVMLVLLVIFIVLAPMFAQALRVDLPRAKATPLNEPVVTDLVLQLDGTITLDGSPADRQRLPEVLAAKRRAAPDLVVRLGADGAAPYQGMAELLALLKQAGIQRIAFATRSVGPRDSVGAGEPKRRADAPSPAAGQ
jgi:biopolymer transport protein ExbD